MIRLGIEITPRCNASCAHCSAGCGPKRRATLGTAELCRIIDEAAGIEPGPFEIDLTGGEPFLDVEQLRTLVAHATSRGATVTCVSNGFWAATVERGIEVLAPLKAAGLKVIAISSSRFHRDFVAADRVRNAIDAAQRSGLRPVLKLALSKSDLLTPDEPAIAAAAALADRVERFAVIGSGRSAGAVADDELIRLTGIPQGRCPSTDTMVAEDGRVLACCSSGPVSALHELGNVRHESLATALGRLASSPVLQRLRTAGPASFVPAIVRAGHGDRLRATYLDACDLCTQLSADPVLAALARADASHDRATPVNP